MQRVNPMSFRTDAVVGQLWRGLTGENALEPRGLHARDPLGLVIDNAHQALGNRAADGIRTHHPHDAVLRARFHTIPVASLERGMWSGRPGTVVPIQTSSSTA